jgi:hypothetical protein
MQKGVRFKMRKRLIVMLLAGSVSLLVLAGCSTVAGQTPDNNPPTVEDRADPIQAPSVADTAGSFQTPPDADPAEPIQAPPLEERIVDFPEFLSVVGTISDVEEIDSNVSLVRIFWDEKIHGSGGDVAELPMHIYLYIDKDTVVLADSAIEAGMFVTAVYRAPTREQQLLPNETSSAVAISDRTISVTRFDDNWKYNNIQLTITDETEIIFQDGQPFDGEIDELQGRALVTIIGMSGTPIPDAENPIHMNWPSKIVVLFEQAVPPIYHFTDAEIAEITQNDLEYQVVMNVIELTAQGAIVSIQSNSDLPLFTGHGFALEVYENGVWRQVPRPNALGITDDPLIIESNSPLWLHHNFSDILPLEQGVYRVVQGIFIDTWLTDGTANGFPNRLPVDTRFEVVAEFTVE